MASQRPARLYQKKSGIFFIRVLLPAAHLGSAPNAQNKRELRRSLRTKSATIARSISSYANALLEHVPTPARMQLLDSLLPHTISAWTLPGGISAADDDDQKRLLGFLKEKPEIEQALIEQIRAKARYLNSLAETAQRGGAVRAAAGDSQAGAGGAPSCTMHLSKAIIGYVYRYEERLKSNTVRTADDKTWLLNAFKEFLGEHHPELGKDPLVHTIHTRHVDAFLQQQEQRPGKRVTKDGKQTAAAPSTMLKKLSGLTHFFEWATNIEKVTLVDPTTGLAELQETWGKAAEAEDFHYWPFSTDHLQRIFEPEFYLAHTRDPDHFWCPLLAAHLGARLGELVNRKLSDIGYVAQADVWYLDVPPEHAKNANSVRRLPITQPLIDLGFIDYVEHVRAMGVEYLFPHRDWETPTAQKKPSKTTSERFAENLDKIGITSPHLVFHSFRHTVISAMHDAGVPLAHAMQICGHEVQSHAIKKGTLRQEDAQSVHLTVYTHAELQRLGTDDPILPLKQALEDAFSLPIDYPRLAACSEIVRRHLKKVAGRIQAGWPAQRATYTKAMIESLPPMSVTA